MADNVHIVCPHCNAVNKLTPAKLKKNPKCGSCHQLLFTGKPISLDTSSFEKHIKKNDIPILVDFWASWSDESKMMAPAVALAATRLEPRLRIAKVNKDTEPDIAKKYGILQVPTVVLFRQGKELNREYGAFDISRILKFIKDNA
ncbi:MAG: thiol reductase thioredoxin [Nitrospirota bacterium]|nr:MAG: thiol reductase thioredoxin [Nitrospirota bacterium]